MANIPDIIPISHDEYYANHIGQTEDNRQFILTTPFVPAYGDERGYEFIALYTFSIDGKLLEAQIDNLGSRSELNKEEARELLDKRLKSLGRVTFCDINVSPFQVEQYGIVFGLIPRELEDEEDEPAIEMQPGNYMAFFEPWDGEYDT
ncbi:hypothetical protein [Rubinisphaera italica]|uniref:Uncharacterized protein n=1 Tax=Rubinisphaera italica TaxID=2527969 RepID=A0A5C5XM05_9PLAN|nr:hypothetical protein [Rubinisphaera italica]TWT63491.1 hypothetical protein Pan54_42440 [Rubinisphaera italica]